MSHNPNIKTIYGMSKEPSGFPNRTDSVVVFDNGTRTLSVSPVSGSFEYYIKGVKYTHLSTASSQVTDTEGLWHFYFDGYALQNTQAFTQSIITEYAYVALVYWDAANNQAIYFGEERHGMTMDGATHLYLHNTNGAVYVNGLGLGDFSIDGTGDASADGYFSVANGIIYDEDIIHTMTDGAPQDLAPISILPVFYREGTEGDWRRKPADPFPVVYPGSVSGYDLTNSLLAYNDFNGATWSLQEVVNNDYVLVHILATNDKVHPVIAILGTSQYNNTPSARAGATTELATLSGLPFSELVPVGTVIFQTSSGYTNAIKGRAVSTDTGEDYIDFRNVAALPIGQINDHGNLSGLSDTDHPASSIYTGTAAFNGNLSAVNTTVQSALDTMDDISIANKALSNLDVTEINTSLLPDLDNVHALGSPSLRWADGYFGPASLHVMSNTAETGTARDWSLGIDTDGYFEIAEGGISKVKVMPSGIVQVQSLTASSLNLGSGQLSVPLGAVGSPSVAFTGDLNTGIYSPGADQLAIATSGTQRIAFGATGTVSLPATAQINLASGAKVTSNLLFDSTPPASYTANLVIGATATIALSAATPISVTLTYTGIGAGTIIVSVNNSTTFTASYTTTGGVPTVNQLITSLQTGSFTSVTLISGSGASQLPTFGGPYAATLSGTTTYLYNVQSLKDPVLAQDAVTKNYADRRFGGVSYTTFPANQGTSGQTLVTNGSGTLSWSTLGATSGGTGQTSYAVGDLIYANTTTSLTKLAGVAAGRVLIAGGVGTAPLWGNANLVWDNTNSRLGIGTATPTAALTVNGSVSVNGSISGMVAAIVTSALTSYTLSSGDSGKSLNFTSSSAVTITVPIGLSSGFTVTITQLGSGQITISPSVGVTVNNRQAPPHTKTAGQYAVVTLLGYGANTYVFAGDTAA